MACLAANTSSSPLVAGCNAKHNIKNRELRDHISSYHSRRDRASGNRVVLGIVIAAITSDLTQIPLSCSLASRNCNNCLVDISQSPKLCFVQVVQDAMKAAGLDFTEDTGFTEFSDAIDDGDGDAAAVSTPNRCPPPPPGALAPPTDAPEYVPAEPPAASWHDAERGMKTWHEFPCLCLRVYPYVC